MRPQRATTQPNQASRSNSLAIGMDVLITDKPTAKVIGDVFTITKQAAEYVVS